MVFIIFLPAGIYGSISEARARRRAAPARTAAA